VGEKLSLPILIKALQRIETREAAASALGDLGPKGRDAVPALLKVLDAQDLADKEKAEAVRMSLIDCLGQIGANARQALPRLEQIARDQAEGEAIRNHAEVAINKIK
jgi:hypothetical protein